MKKTPITTLATMALLAALAAAPLFAQGRVPVPTVPPAPKTPPLPATETASGAQRVNESRPASAEGTMDIDTMSGSIHLIGWDRNEVAVTGTLGEGVERLEVGGDSIQTFIHLVIPKNARHVGESNLEIHLPQGTRVWVRSLSADIEAAKIIGSLDASSVSGDIRVSGNPHEVTVSSVSGDVHLSVSSPRVRIKTVSGGIALRDGRGDVDLSNVGGEISVQGEKFERGRFSTANGKIHFEGSLTPNGVFTFQAVNGTVDLLLPDDVKADFSISSRDIKNEFGPEAQAVSDYGPRTKRLNFSTGSGGASVSINTFNGTVRLRKKP